MPRASPASGDCCAGLAKAAVCPLLQLTFEKDPEGYSFTLTLGLQGLEVKSGTDASATPVTQAFPWRRWPVPLQNRQQRTMATAEDFGKPGAQNMYL